MTAEIAAEQIYWDDIQEGQPIPSLRSTPSIRDGVVWGAASGDFNPLHYDSEFARGRGLKGPIIPGAFKHALLGRMLHEWVRYRGGIKRFAVSYRGMDVPGEEMTCRGVITRKYEEDGKARVDLEIWIESPQGQKTTPGTATVVLPRRR